MHVTFVACSKPLIQKCEDEFAPETHHEKVQLPQQNVLDSVDGRPTGREQDVIDGQSPSDGDSSTPSDITAKDKPSSSLANHSNASGTTNANVQKDRQSNIDTSTTKEASCRQPAVASRQDPAISDTHLEDRKHRVSSDCQSEHSAAPSISLGEVQEVVSHGKSAELSNGTTTPKENGNPQSVARPNAFAEKVDVPTTSSPKSDVGKIVDSTNNGTKQAEPTNHQATYPEEHKSNEDKMKKHKPKEGPTSMQTLLVPKADELQGQDKSHSTDGVGKHDKQISKPSADVAKTFSDTKKSLRPTRAKVS